MFMVENHRAGIWRCATTFQSTDEEVHTRFHETRTIDLDPAKLYLINPGSVGQPRDGCPLSSFAIYDSEAPKVTIYLNTGIKRKAPIDVTPEPAGD